ncbi:MAG: hypothetical protein JXR37_12555 [Kiritimatiellae bacterium]|nr:hypothetical protein [Kiritimatiellia bacterium]
MKIEVIDPPRLFEVGRASAIRMKDCARVRLAPDEQVTFVTDSGAEYDVARKSWGFYATPSLNGRLRRFGLRAALVKGPASKFYLFLVEKGKEPEWHAYIEREALAIVCWLDDDAVLDRLEREMKDA